MESSLARHGGLASVIGNNAMGSLSTPQAYTQHLQFPEVFVKRLCMTDVLKGHMGCVNRLAWNSEGTMLASGSDDHSVALWHYPDTQKRRIHFMTQHEGNIFGVAFMPFSNNTQIVTGAMDGSLQLHQLDANPAQNRATLNAHTSLQSQHGAFDRVQTYEYFRHKSRIKAIDVDPTDANLVWSSSEDGTVQQFDVRCRPGDQDSNRNLLIQLSQGHSALGILSIRINKARPWQMGVAAYDPYSRIFDRRMLSIGRTQDPETSTQPCLKFVPPHLCLQPPRNGHDAFPTYIDFGRKGNKMVASYHGEHAYSFNIDGSTSDSSFVRLNPPSEVQDNDPQCCLTRGNRLPEATPISRSFRSQDLPANAEAAKKEGNQAFFDSDDNAAVWHYTKAIHLAPNCADLYVMRATAYLKRDWMGDSFAGLVDCEKAISLDPALIKAYYRRVTALISLSQLEVAQQALNLFKKHFPDEADQYNRLEGSLQKEQQSHQQRNEGTRPQTNLEGHENLSAGVSASPAANVDIVMETNSEDMQGSNEQFEANIASSSYDVHRGHEQFDEDYADQFSSESYRNDESDEGEDEFEAQGDDTILTQIGRERIPNNSQDKNGIQHYAQRYVGHRNLNTDIKEACFLGGHDDMVACGSDDGRVFIYNAETGYPVKCLHQADEDVVNCVRPHPFLSTLATSGIESVVKLWEPGNFKDGGRSVMSFVKNNQQKMKDQACMIGRISPAMLSAITQRPDMWQLLMQIENQGTDFGRANQPQDATCRLS